MVGVGVGGGVTVRDTLTVDDHVFVFRFVSDSELLSERETVRATVLDTVAETVRFGVDVRLRVIVAVKEVSGDSEREGVFSPEPVFVRFDLVRVEVRVIDAESVSLIETDAESESDTDRDAETLFVSLFVAVG
jgi:hypothetical protein